MSVVIENLEFQWPESDFRLEIPSLTIDSGKSVLLTGSSGSGKSTLLNLVTGILKPAQGSISLMGTDITRLGNRKMDRFRAKNIGIIFQQFNLIPYLDVETNIRLAAYFGHTSDAGLTEKILGLLDTLNLPRQLLNQAAANLSVGQQQRVAIARAVINSPAFIIADEPTSALDVDARDGFMQLLMKVAVEHNSTIIFVSHDQALAEYFPDTLSISEINRAVAATNDVT